MGNLFDTPIDRRGKNSAKWSADFIGSGEGELLPFWVADTDFPAPRQVNEALAACVEHGIFGYTTPPEDCAEAVVAWQKRRHRFHARADWTVFIAGIDCALATAIQAYTRPGDKVLINSPVYTPFFEVLKKNRREVVDSPLILQDGKYRFDIEDFAHKAKGAKMWMFCNPQNPSSRCMTREELQAHADICMENNIIILSDEIHSDIVYSGHRHIPIASLSEQICVRTVTCVSASKTFSVAGLVASAALIADKQLREQFLQTMEQNHINTNILGLVAMRAAFTHGDEYADQLVAYLEQNRDFAVSFFRRKIPWITPVMPEATFLLWLDCTELKLPREALYDFFTDAGVRLCGGSAYLEPTGQFARLNFGCSRVVLQEGLERIAAAACKLRG